MAVSLLRLLRPIIRVSSLIAPRLTGRLAFKAFCTPPRAHQGVNSGPAVKSMGGRLGRAAARAGRPAPDRATPRTTS